MISMSLIQVDSKNELLQNVVGMVNLKQHDSVRMDYNDFFIKVAAVGTHI